jgi:phosphohistidine phosphatase
MKLYIVRHAWAAERDDARYPDDRLRPLTDEGRKRFSSFLKKVAGQAFRPALVATSPLVRCRQTADLIAEHFSDGPRIVERPELAPGSDLEGLISWTAQQDGEPIAWIGHAPDVGRLAATLIGNSTASIHLAKGAICLIEFDATIAAGRGELQWLLTAKALGC